MKKHNLFVYFVAFSLLSAWTSCDKDGDSKVLPNGYIEQTVEGASTITLEGYENSALGFSVLKPKGFQSPIFIKDKAFTGSNCEFMEGVAEGLSAMTTLPVDGTWQTTIPVVEGQSYWVRNVQHLETKYVKFRVAYIRNNAVGLEYFVMDDTTLGWNVNCNIDYVSGNKSVMNLEIPAIKEVDGIYREHYVSFGGQNIMNLATSWNVALRHAAWVAFSFDKNTALDKVKRTNAWGWDPQYDFNNMGGVEEADHKSDGFDKGHIAASEDRVYCKEANEQTFFYTNISAQIGNFNQNYWAVLEEQVQAWGRATQGSTFDKVYITKGATLSKPLANFTGTVKANDGKFPTTDAEGKTVKGLFVPSYYYMAILAEKDGQYQAISFLVPHSETLPKKPTAGDFQVYGKSIAELEQETGIDFFCNLPDSIERVVEASYDKDAWSWK